MLTLCMVLNFRVMGPVSSEGTREKKSKAQKAKLQSREVVATIPRPILATT